MKDKIWIWLACRRLTKAALTERFWIWLAWLLPHELVKWCGFRIGAYATGPASHPWETVPEITYMDVMARWDES